MQNRVEQHHRTPQEVPPVARPRGATWRSLQADGVVWEGQVLLVGGDIDLAARMIVTHRRVAFVRGGELVLEIPRGWLRQEPVLRRDGILELFVATPENDPFDEPMRVPLRMREGHPAAGHIIAMLAPGGVRRIAPEAMTAFERARGATSSASHGGFWDGVDTIPLSRREGFNTAALDFPPVDDSPNDENAELANLAPLEPPDRLVRAPSNPPRRAATNAYPIAGMLPRDQRRSPWTLVLRIAALTILLGTAAALGAGRLNIQLPGSGAEPLLAAPTPTVTASTTEDGTTPATESVGAVLNPDDLTAVAMGVGGPEETTMEAGSSAEAIAAATEPAAPTAPAADPTEPVIPTPAPTTASEPDASATAETVPASERAEATVATSAEAANAEATPPGRAQEATATAEPSLAQEIEVGPLRVAITTALRDASLPKYGLPASGGEWVLVMAEIDNTGDAPASLAMRDFRLLDRASGDVATLDTGTDVIASLAGLQPARGATDTIAVDPGESTETLLLYLLPTDSSDDLALLVGQSEVDLVPTAADRLEAPRDARLAYMSRGWQRFRQIASP